MPLLDHFNPPLSIRRHWQGLHSAWASAIVTQLNRMLPDRYFAEPNVHHGARIEIDVATFEETPPGRGIASGGAATAIWSPSVPTSRLPVELGNLEEFEVNIYNDEEGPRLVAAVELVSPANKDRPAHRRAFATKCAALLQQEASVAVVDVVTTRRESLHEELLALLSVEGGTSVSGLLAAEYRIRRSGVGASLEIWLESPDVGRPLPTLPLWLAPDLALPLDLEETYRSACTSLRI